MSRGIRVAIPRAGPDSNNRFLSAFVKSVGPDRSKGRGCEKARTWFAARKACVRRVHSRGDKRRLEEPPCPREWRARAHPPPSCIHIDLLN